MLKQHQLLLLVRCSNADSIAMRELRERGRRRTAAVAPARDTVVAPQARVRWG
jgi:hypothetical protein